MSNVAGLSEKFALFSEHWHPKIVGELNQSDVKLSKLKVEFVWHRHEREDELLRVVKGSLVIKLRDRDLMLREGQFVNVPRGVEHLPVAADEVHVVLLEPKTIVNTGDAETDRIVPPEWI